MTIFNKWLDSLKESYRAAKKESEYKIPYRIVGNGVLVADARDIVNSGAYKEQLRKAVELEKMIKAKQHET